MLVSCRASIPITASLNLQILIISQSRAISLSTHVTTSLMGHGVGAFLVSHPNPLKASSRKSTVLVLKVRRT